MKTAIAVVLVVLVAVLQGSYRSWRVLEFKSYIFQAWKVLESGLGLESHVNQNSCCDNCFNDLSEFD